jgi:hypothetical protein
MEPIRSDMLRASAWKGILGEWEMSSPIFKGGSGRAVFEWIEGGSYLAFRSAPPQHLPASIWLIGGDDEGARYTAFYTDSRGISRIYQTQMVDGVWTIWRTGIEYSQRFEAKVDFSAGTMRGAWYSTKAGGDWKIDFELIYTRRR